MNVLRQLFDEMYTLAVEGTAVTDSATELAENYLISAESRLEAAEALVAFESLKACGSGFACGLAGDVLLPLTVTADICSSLFIQMRMCAAVAVTGGHEVGDPMVRLLCWGAIAGDACLDAVNRVITRLMAKALSLPEAEKAVLSVLRQVLLSKNSGLLLKTGLLIPLFGGALNGTAAWLVTRLTGQIAIRLFIPPPAPPCAA
ncbi:EcsC family protein [Enterobacter sp. DC3]|uniref:EcsC family protein n=1 Tax=Enterobacter sp. DC3 TaxID=1395579 RepID=UPI0030837ECD